MPNRRFAEKLQFSDERRSLPDVQYSVAARCPFTPANLPFAENRPGSGTSGRETVSHGSSEVQAVGEEYRSLMARYQAGDGQAFEALYARLAPELRRLVLRRAPEAVLPDDVVEQIFMELHRARGSYSPRNPFEPWLAAIVAHVIGTHRRPPARRRAFSGFLARLVSPRHAG